MLQLFSHKVYLKKVLKYLHVEILGTKRLSMYSSVTSGQDIKLKRIFHKYVVYTWNVVFTSSFNAPSPHQIILTVYFTFFYNFSNTPCVQASNIYFGLGVYSSSSPSVSIHFGTEFTGRHLQYLGGYMLAKTLVVILYVVS